MTGIGSDIVYGGSGTDCVIYDFDLATAQSRITYNQLTECILVSGGSGDQAWLDQLYGIEKLALDGYEILVTSLFPDDPINSAPVVNIQVLNEPISVGNGQSLKLELPEDIFTDVDGVYTTDPKQYKSAKKIKMILTDFEGISIDTPIDLEYAKSIWNNNE